MSTPLGQSLSDSTVGFQLLGFYRLTEVRDGERNAGGWGQEERTTMGGPGEADRKGDVQRWRTTG